jgi:serine phosphatase RsbU (regulator of sigma subunit)
VAADADYTATSVMLDPGDAMLLYTDGLTDARAPDRVLGEDDLLALLARGRGLSADGLTEFLEHDATGGRDPRDDIAMLLVEMAG